MHTFAGQRENTWGDYVCFQVNGMCLSTCLRFLLSVPGVSSLSQGLEARTFLDHKQHVALFLPGSPLS